MNLDKLIKADIRNSITQLRTLREWLGLNMGNLSLSELKKIRTEIEQMEIVVAIGMELEQLS